MYAFSSVDPFNVSCAGTKACDDAFFPLFAGRTTEMAVAALCNDRLEMRAMLMFQGDETFAPFPVSSVISAAQELFASAIILAHNHPSGLKEPGPYDLELTRRVQLCCEPLDIVLVDHLIYAGDYRYSFRQHGLLD